MISKYHGLYIHIPLCKSICRYCDFYKVTPGKWIGADLFLEALEIDFKNLPNNFSPKTIFIGGGTPTALSADEYKNMLSLICQYIDISMIEEWTTEANPYSLDTEKLDIMLEAGINRLSIGVQSFNDKALKLLGRMHDSKQAVDVFNLARSCGFDQISIDMIQSIPNMKQIDINNDLDYLSKLNPDHISYYNLIYEPGTPMTRDRDKGVLKVINDEEEANIYYYIKENLERLGYNQYEISNFSYPKKECIHNILYWTGGEYIGCGPSSHSHWKNERFSKINDINIYYDNLLNNRSIINMKESLEPTLKAKECLIMWLRLSSGVNLTDFKMKTGFSLEDLYNNEINELIDNKLLEYSKSSIKIPESKRFLSNAIFSELI